MPEEAERRKRQRAAQAVLEIVQTAGKDSDLEQEQGEDTQEEWKELYLTRLTGGATQAGFEHRTLQKAVAAWRRRENG